jgi:hypothetical protein
MVSTGHPRREIDEFAKLASASAEPLQRTIQTPIVVNNSGCFRMPLMVEAYQKFRRYEFVFRRVCIRLLDGRQKRERREPKFRAASGLVCFPFVLGGLGRFASKNFLLSRVRTRNWCPQTVMWREPMMLGPNFSDGQVTWAITTKHFATSNPTN